MDKTVRRMAVWKPKIGSDSAPRRRLGHLRAEGRNPENMNTKVTAVETIQRHLPGSGQYEKMIQHSFSLPGH